MSFALVMISLWLLTSTLIVWYWRRDERRYPIGNGVNEPHSAFPLFLSGFIGVFYLMVYIGLA